MDKDACRNFMLNPAVNPLTGRNIEAGKATHTKLMKECAKFGSVDILEAPPMGPFLHWQMNAPTPFHLEQNARKMMKHLIHRYNCLEEALVVGKQECEEIIDIATELKSSLLQSKQQKLHKIISETKRLLRTSKVIDNRPTPTKINTYNVFAERLKNREVVWDIWSDFRTSLASIEAYLYENQNDIAVGPREYARVVKSQAYLDYLIAHKIFTEEDIYERVFPGKNCFEDFKKKYAEYKKLYKKHHGNSPKELVFNLAKSN